MSETKRKPGRPPTVNAKSAMPAIVELFRAKGYAAVSLDELSEVTGLSRPSLYRAFGTKLDMYIQAMDVFGEQVVERAVPALLADGSLETALSNFFEAMLSIYFRNKNIVPGCLVFGTAPSSADEYAVQTRLMRGITSTDDLMRTRILKSEPTCTAQQLDTAVHLVSNTLIAFSARAKSGAPQNELIEMGRQSARAICTLLQTDQ